MDKPPMVFEQYSPDNHRGFFSRYLIFISVLLPGSYACLMHHVFEHIYTKTGWIEKDSDGEESSSELP